MLRSAAERKSWLAQERWPHRAYRWIRALLTKMLERRRPDLMAREWSCSPKESLKEAAADLRADTSDNDRLSCESKMRVRDSRTGLIIECLVWTNMLISNNTFWEQIITLIKKSNFFYNIKINYI